MNAFKNHLVLKLVLSVIAAHVVTEVFLEFFQVDGVLRDILESLTLAAVTGAFAYQATRRLCRMAEESRRIAERDFSRRMPVRSRDEIGRLAESLNQMAENLEMSFEDLQMKNEYIGGLNRNFEVVTAELEAANRALKEAHGQLLQREKLASVGQLAAGVAHEINNPLGFINSNLATLDGYVRDMARMLQQYRSLEQTAERSADESLKNSMKEIGSLKEEIDMTFLLSDVRQLIQESRDGVDRVKKIVLDLKEFSHVDQAEWEESDLHRGLDSTLNIAWNELKYRVRVIKEYGDLPRVPCYPQQVNQVFMNILINAAQAIPEKGTIRIRTYVDSLQAVVEIQDNGAGIPEEIRKKIFDPFFTTKPVGKGTGLGLSIAYGIIQRHQGRIEVESRPGEGTTFRIFLPIRDAKQLDEGIPAAMGTKADVSVSPGVSVGGEA
ncbi:MAG: HAMP domain-containing protein [Nitrospirae bacterium]|nr:HAMP domain-containing protein [Nitrospirota bacterium]